MFRVADILILLVILVSLYSLGPGRIVDLGGGIALLSLCAFYYLLSYTYKRFQGGFTSLIVMTVGLVGLNYLSYLEKNKTADFRYVFAGFLVLGLCILICHFNLSLRPLMHASASVDTLDVRKRIAERIILVALPGLGLFALFTGFIFILNPESQFFRTHGIRYVPIATFWIIMSFLALLIVFRKIPDEYVGRAFGPADAVSVPKLPRLFIGGALLVFAAGAIVEVLRGQWFFWTESFFLYIVVLGATWKVWKHVFAPPRPVIPRVESGDVPSLIQDFRFITKYIAFNVAIVTVCILTLAVLSTM